MVVAFFKAELDPGIHLVKDGRSLERALDGARSGRRANVFGVLKVISNGRIETVLEVGLPASIAALTARALKYSAVAAFSKFTRTIERRSNNR